MFMFVFLSPPAGFTQKDLDKVGFTTKAIASDDGVIEACKLDDDVANAIQWVSERQLGFSLFRFVSACRACKVRRRDYAREGDNHDANREARKRIDFLRRRG